MSANNPILLQQRTRLGFTLLMLLVFIFVIWSAQNFRMGADLFPQVMGMVGLGLCVIELVTQWLGRQKKSTTTAAEVSTADLDLTEEERSVEGWLSSLGVFAWIFLYGLLALALSMPIATCIWVPLLIVGRFKGDWRIALAISIGLLSLMWLLRTTLALQWPSGWIL